MGAFPIPEHDAYRHGPYVDELHEFLDSYGLPYGSPNDLLGVALRLREPGPFAGDLQLVLRSILFREGRAMSRAGLLDLLAFAIGGEEMDRPPKYCWQALSRLYAFVSEVRRRPLNPSSDGGQLIPFPAAAVAQQEHTPTGGSGLPAAPPADRTVAAESRRAPVAHADRPTPLAQPVQHGATPWLWTLLIAVTGALVIAALLVFALQPKANSQTHVPPARAASPALHVPKPSPYGEAFQPTHAPARKHRALVAASAAAEPVVEPGPTATPVALPAGERVAAPAQPAPSEPAQSVSAQSVPSSEQP